MMQSVAGPSLLTSIPTIDDVLHDHASALRHDFIALSEPRVSDRESVRRDRERPSRAREDRGRCGLPRPRDLDQQARSTTSRRPSRSHTITWPPTGVTAWIAEIEGMIADHHKITPSTPITDSLVEAFRRADWIDVTRGLRTFGLPRPLIRSLFAAWPSAGFHWRLVQLTLERFRTHPLTPLPMVKL